MSTSYFILSKSSTASTTDNDENQLYLNDSRLSYILPRTLMSCYCADGLFESGLIEWSKQFCSTNSTFLDIGAHTGTYTISLSKHCKRVVSFEPQQMTYYALCGSVAMSNLRNVQCLQVGLGSPDQVGISTLNIVSNDGGGSSIHGQPILGQEAIVIQTLDHVAQCYGISNVGFVKIDVEGNEYDVLLGAEHTLQASNYPPILFECDNPAISAHLFLFMFNLKYNIVRVRGASNMYLASRPLPSK